MWGVFGMLKFSSEAFEKEVKECLKYVEQHQKGPGGLNLDFYGLLDEDFDPEDYDDFIINESYEVSLQPDKSDQGINLTFRELIDLINEAKKVRLIDNVKCISERCALIRVEPKSYKDYIIINVIPESFQTELSFDSVKLTCSLKSGVTLFGLLVHFSGDFEENYPSVSSDDLFIEIKSSGILDEECVDKVANSYMFELYATHGIKIYRKPRPVIADEEIDDEVLQKNYVLRPLLLGKGIDEVIKLFNEAEDGFSNSDYSIMQYTKVIEYVSPTVVRQDITSKALTKLSSPRALNPDANYVKEIEIMFYELKQKYDTDRNAIKETVKKCCDITEVVDCAPRFLDKVANLKKGLSQEKCNKESLLNAAYDQLADSISDTRNQIAHAKANHKPKGWECPDEYKSEFANMLKILAVQVIRWFSSTNENNRIVP